MLSEADILGTRQHNCPVTGGGFVSLWGCGPCARLVRIIRSLGKDNIDTTTSIVFVPTIFNGIKIFVCLLSSPYNMFRLREWYDDMGFEIIRRCKYFE